MSAPTLTAALRSAGYGHRNPSGDAYAQHEIYDVHTGRVVGHLRAGEAWDWLRAIGALIDCLECDEPFKYQCGCGDRGCSTCPACHFEMGTTAVVAVGVSL